MLRTSTLAFFVGACVKIILYENFVKLLLPPAPLALTTVPIKPSLFI